MKDIRRHYSSSTSTTTTNVQQQQRRCKNSGDCYDEQRRQRQRQSSVSVSSSSSSSMFLSDNMNMKLPTKRRTIFVLFLFLGVTVATVLNFYYGLSAAKFYNPVVDLYDDFEYMRKVTEVENNANANPKQQQQLQSSAKNNKKVPLQLSYIHESELQKNHMFSDSWLLNRKRFLEIDSKQIYKIEDAALLPAWPRGKYDKVKHPYPHAKMLVDWTDFSVEHLSKWWGMLQIDTRRKDYEKADVLFPHVISFLDNYIQRRLLNNMVSPSSSSSSPLLLPPSTELENTIAMIAFMPYKRRELTSYSLAAATVPLFNAGFSRLIIVGIQDNDHEYTREACVLLKSIVDKNRNNNSNNTNDGKNSTDDLTIWLNDNNHNSNNSSNNSNNTIATIGYTTSSSTTKKNYKMRMEIAHVQIINKEWVKGEKAPGRKRVDTKSNIPRGAVIGMQKALMGKLDSKKERIEWLGENHDVDYWKYIYLTEPDTILNLNHDLLPLFRTALDDGISLFPHRLHPLPHETDLPTNTTFNRGLYLPDYPPFSNVTTLDPLGDDYISCCDDGLSAPGKENWTMQRKGTNDLNNICSSNRRWWECGFNEYDNNSIEEFNMTKIIQGHVRLLSYRMMRLQNGIGAVFGTNNQGRQCIPSKTSCDDHDTRTAITKEPKKIKR